MTLDALVLLLWRRAWVLVIGAILGASAAFGATSMMTRVYSATATSFVTAVPAPGKAASYESAQFAVSRAKSYPQLLKSPEVLQAVITELRLSDTVPELAKALSAENPVDTLLVQVTAEAGSAEQAAQIANSAAKHMSLRIQELETSGGKRTSPVDVQVAVPATAPQVAAWPRPVVNYVLGGVVGGVFGAFIVLAADALQRARRARDSARAKARSARTSRADAHEQQAKAAATGTASNAALSGMARTSARTGAAGSGGLTTTTGLGGTTGLSSSGADPAAPTAAHSMPPLSISR
ncbi:capsular polysaccharide biosynthesis protein [Kineosphaera limosa]|uniref:Polysaccharide chain length determinant N-terminal domain-containing protein n=1 Tax=Kineosphaera limosa NBRC 100340 TaxID=1184609 RepID=K6X5F3_9MICO|nr:Wzz/FepE/Etk N-terminal domain-containing protein [Kineosphaera limosa]NYE02183.1 capsular polysaccharide biosynthesis protein [Kineosphaera limosa]GAB94034.1 putative protein-tyrosine kinase [Kineosphaera limosa NBRC 100340]